VAKSNSFCEKAHAKKGQKRPHWSLPSKGWTYAQWAVKEHYAIWTKEREKQQLNSLRQQEAFIAGNMNYSCIYYRGIGWIAPWLNTHRLSEIHSWFVSYSPPLLAPPSGKNRNSVAISLIPITPWHDAVFPGLVVSISSYNVNGISIRISTAIRKWSLQSLPMNVTVYN